MKQKYYNSKALRKLDCDYNLILGERSNGKSFDIKNYCLKRAFENPEKCKFIYLRRWDLEIKKAMVEQYFTDAQIEFITSGEYNSIRVYNSKIYLYNSDDKEAKLCVGYSRALTMEEHYTSGIYTDCENVIFEEFISRNYYLPQEPLKLQQFVSTVARRGKIKVFLIGNTISRVCPYFTEWELKNIPKQKQGTIDIYEHFTDQIDEETGEKINIKIAVEYAENSGKNSKMFFGTSSKMITSGVWQSSEKPHLPGKLLSDYFIMYTFVLDVKNFKFLCRFLVEKYNGAACWYIEPKTTPPKENERIISDKIILSPFATRGLIPLSQNEAKAFEYLKNGEIYFSDNLTGADFDVCIKNIQNMQ